MLNGVRIEPNRPTKLHNGDTLVFGACPHTYVLSCSEAGVWLGRAGGSSLLAGWPAG